LKPAVSVLIGAFNNADSVRRAAESMLGQTVSDLELLIIDDGSADQTGQVAAEIADADARARVLSLPTNVGISTSLNAGLRAAQADVVAVLDADDWSEPVRLERQLGLLRQQPGVAVVGCRMREVDETGNELCPRTKFAPGEVNDVLTRFNPVPNSCSAFRRILALQAGGYDARYRWAAEYDLWLRLAEGHVVYALDDVLATRVMSTRNVAATRERAQIAEGVSIRMRAMARRRSLRGMTGLMSPAVSYLTPIPLKRARRRRLGQAP
jgi:glycosyltransferase involved in cell wall biosynthesis